MKKRINKKLLLIILLITTIATGTYAIYKSSVNGQVEVNMGSVIAEIKTSESSTSISIDPAHTSSAYKFSVNNYIIKDQNKDINPVLCDYYIKIDGIDEQLISYKVYYLDQQYNEIELNKETTGTFAGYYKSTQPLKISKAQTDNYIIRMNTIGQYSEDTEMNVNIDLGYIQLSGEEEIEILPNAPKLAEGMIPIQWDETRNCWAKATADNASYNWYDYSTQKWANVALVKTEGINTREYYESASFSTQIMDDDILAMFVWIPRFVYKIPSDFYHKTLTEEEISSNSEKENLVDVSFSNEVNDYYNTQLTVYDYSTIGKDASDTWITCPAFKFGDKELEGFWMAKFKSSENNGAINIIPCKTIKTSINIGSKIQKLRSMEAKDIYGWTPLTGTIGTNQIYENDNNGFDTHLIKNSEWAAVTFLAHSKYGKNKSSINHIATGDTENTTGGSTDINTVYITNQSKTTTGNVYGVYDMSTKVWDEVSAVIGGSGKSNSTIFEQMDERYKDVYVVPEGVDYNLEIGTQKSVYGMFKYINGAAIWEISSAGGTYATNGNIAGWYNGRSNAVSGSNLIIARGGSYVANNKDIASELAFGYANGTEAASSRGFRPIISVCDGL